MSAFRAIKLYLIYWTHIVFGTILFLVIMGRLAITHGPKSFFRVKKRNAKPNCVMNPKLGTHTFIKTAEGVKLHYVESGNQTKPLMLLVHGFPDCWFTWKEQIIAFQKHYWVIAVDTRGCGESDKLPRKSDYTTDKLAGDLKNMVTKLGRSSCILVGHDWGGMICWEFGYLFPEMVDKLIIMNAPHPYVFSNTILDSWTQRTKSLYAFFFQVPWIPEFALRWNDYSMFLRPDKGHKTSFDYQEQVEAVKYSLSRPGTPTASLNYYRANGLNVAPMLNRKVITCPTFVIWGMKDKFLSSLLLDGLEDVVKDLKIERIEDAGHWVHQNQSIRVNQLVLQHLQ